LPKYANRAQRQRDRFEHLDRSKERVSAPTGWPPVVTINGLAVTLKSFSDSTIVATLATAVTGDYTVKITNSKRQSSACTVAEPPQKADFRNTKNKSDGVNVAAFYMHRDAAIEDSLPRAEQPSQAENKGCNPIAPPGIVFPPLPAYCHQASEQSQK
jgi:hypothetical protein